MGVVANELMNLKDNLPKGILQRSAEWKDLQYDGRYDPRSVKRFLEKHLRKSTDTKIDVSTVSDFLRLTAGVKQNQARIMDQHAKKSNIWNWHSDWVMQAGDMITTGREKVDYAPGKKRVTEELNDAKKALRIFNARRLPGSLISYDDREWARDYIKNQLESSVKATGQSFLFDQSKISDFDLFTPQAKRFLLLKHKFVSASMI